MEFLKIWDVILRRKWIIFIIFMSFFLTVLIGTLLIKPSYEAEAKILVKQSDSLNSLMKNLGILTSITTPTTSATTGTQYDTDIALTTIKPLSKRIIAQLDLRNRKGEVMKPSELSSGKLKKMILPAPYISVEQEEEADILTITSKATSAKQAADIANVAAKLYIEESMKRSSEEFKAAKAVIEAQIKKVQSDYNLASSALAEDMIKRGYVDLSAETQSLIDVIQKLKTNLDDTNRDIATYQKKEKEIKKQLSSMKKYRTEYEEFRQNTQLSDLKTKLNDRLVTIASKAVEKRPEHPDYKLLEAETEAARKMIKEEVELLLDSKRSAIDPVYSALEMNQSQNSIDYMTASAKKKIYAAYIDAYQKELLKIPLKKVEYQKLDVDLSVKKTNYSDLLSALQKLGVAEKMMLSNIRIIEPADIPEDKDFPKTSFNMFFGLIFGLFFGIVGAFFVESIDHTIRDPKDLKNFKDLAYLGTITNSQALGDKKIISRLDPKSSVVDAFRTVRNGIFSTPMEKPLKTISVTSSVASEGASFVAANLAITFSREGRKVILVELNLRQPDLARYFGLPMHKGIANVLADDLNLQDAIMPSGVANVDLLPCGSAPADPGTLIQSQKLKDVFSALEETYDIIVIDTPPAIPMNDAADIGRYAQGTLFVIEASKTSFSMVEQSFMKLEKAGLNLIGAVINKKQNSGSKYYNYFYSEKETGNV